MLVCAMFLRLCAAAAAAQLDSRLLLMEFSLGILLHKGQVDLTGHFMSKAVSGQSMCHQVSALGVSMLGFL